MGKLNAWIKLVTIIGSLHLPSPSLSLASRSREWQAFGALHLAVTAEAADALVGAVGILLSGAALYALNSDFQAFISGIILRVIVFLLATGLVALLLTCFGLVGVAHQEAEGANRQPTKEDERREAAYETDIFPFPPGSGGRYLLGAYQLGLVYLLIVAIWSTLNVSLTLESLEQAQSDPSLPFDKFERHFSTEFNNIYFDAVCGEPSDYTLFWDFVDDTCPVRMSQAA
eukprot:scaffold7114_cov264-Pinguiococcus_pyrenoidosus.AAC.5